MPARQRQQRVPVRHPIHVGTRAFGSAEYGARVMVVMPVFPGEVVRGLRIEALGVTRTQETNFDQPPIFEWYGAYVPWQWPANSSGPALTVAELDNIALGVLQDTTDIPLGGDPDASGGTVDYLGFEDFHMNRIFLRRQRIGLPVPVTIDALENPDARFFDSWHTSWSTPIRVKAAGFIMVWAMTHTVAANTVFGIQGVVASTQSPVAVMGALMRPGDVSGNTNQDKAQELFWGGDNYIEADSFKATSRRQFCIVQANISLPPKLGRRS